MCETLVAQTVETPYGPVAVALEMQRGRLAVRVEFPAEMPPDEVATGWARVERAVRTIPGLKVA